MKAIFLAGLLAFAGISMPLKESINKLDFENVVKQEEAVDCDTDPGIAYAEELMKQDSQSTLTAYPTFLEAYFSGLTTNMGENYKGSCGYVALGMLLSYYDTFLDDSIIPEAYDVASQGETTNIVSRKNSPGIYHDVIENGKNMSATEYYNKIRSMQSYSLHSKLMMIGKDLNILDLNKGDSLGETTHSEQINILSRYLEIIGKTDYTIESVSDYYSNPTTEQVKSFIKENIDKGYPVLLSAKKTSASKSGHSMICYSYDGTKFYGNMGWTSSSYYAYINIAASYSVFRNATVLKFNKDHVHSDNYEVKHFGHIDKYCFCNSNIMTYTSVMSKYDKPSCFNGTFEIPNWVTSIESEVFKNNYEIKNITYEPNGHLSEIKSEAFYNCYDLQSVELPRSLKRIGILAFSYCDNLQSVIFESGSLLQTVELYAFKECAKLKYFQIPSNVNTFDTGVFHANIALESITFSDALTNIGLSAFGGGDGTDLGHMTIYTEAPTKKIGWDENWNGTINYFATMQGFTEYECRPVFWGCTLSTDKTYVLSINKTSTSISNGNAANGISAPNRYGYLFDGWYTNSEYTGISYDANEIANAPNGVYYAKWI